MDVSLSNALTEASEQYDSSVRKRGEEELEQLSTQNGYLSGLLKIYAEIDAPFVKRWVAIICLKNAVDKGWRRPTAISPTERESIRQQLIALAARPDDARLHRQCALVTAKICRSDFPKQWPSLLDNLYGIAVTAADVDVLRSTLLSLQQCLKALSNVRIGPAKRALQEFSVKSVTYFGDLYIQLLQADKDDVAYLVLKILCLLVEAIDRAHRVPSVRSVWENAFQKVFDAGGTAGKHLLKLAKMHMRLIESRPLVILGMPNSQGLLEGYVHWIHQNAYQLRNNSDSDLDRLAVRVFSFLAGALRVRPQRVLPLSMRPRDDADREDFQNACKQVSSIITMDLFPPLIDCLALRISELELWEEDPAEFVVDDLRPDGVHTAAEKVIAQLLRNNEGSEVQAWEFIQRKLPSEEALRCLETGASSFQWVNLSQVLQSLPENNPPVLRRACLLIAAWVPQSNPEFQRDALLFAGQALYSSSDLPVRLAALHCIRTCCDDLDFEPQNFEAIGDAVFEGIFSLLRTGDEVSKTVLEIMGTIVEALTLDTMRLEQILNALLPLWADSSLLVRGALLQTLAQVVTSAREKSPAAYCALPLLVESLQVEELMDDALSFWRAITVNAPVATPEVMQLFPLAQMTVQRDLTSYSIGVLEGYILLDPQLVLPVDFAQVLMELFERNSPLELCVACLNLAILQPEPWARTLVPFFSDYLLKADSMEERIIAGRMAVVLSKMSIAAPIGTSNEVIAAWLGRVKAVSDPLDRKIILFGATCEALAEPTLFVAQAANFMEMWTLVGDEDVPIQADSVEEFTQEQVRIQARRLADPANIPVRPFVDNAVSRLRSASPECANLLENYVV